MQSDDSSRRLGRFRRVRSVLETAYGKRGLAQRAGFVYGALLLLFGLAWLLRVTARTTVSVNWPVAMVLLLSALVLNRSNFFMVVEQRGTAITRYSGTLGGLITTSALLLFGFPVLWFVAVSETTRIALAWSRTMPMSRRWRVASVECVNLGAFLLGLLCALAVYRWLGGSFPLPGLVAPAGAAVLVSVTVRSSLWLGHDLLLRWAGLFEQTTEQMIRELGFELIAALPEFFAIVIAAVYTQMGLGPYLLLIGGIFVISISASRHSQAVAVSAQRTRELTQLEQLGRAMIAAPPEFAALPALLRKYVPAVMPYADVDIRLCSGQVLHRPRELPSIDSPALWSWFCVHPEPRFVAMGQPLPWTNQLAEHPLAIVPILDIDTSVPLGGIYAVPVEAVSVIDAFSSGMLPALQSLAAQIASALHHIDEYARMLAYQRVTQELAFAWEIQASLLPSELPSPAGWQLAARLRPARETSGDFYDVFNLPGERLGLIIADVSGKGTGPALFMALTRTLLRTYALQYINSPAEVLYATNQRMLADTRTSLFVTAFYGVLELQTGYLHYANAGHNPPYVLGAESGTQPLELRNTGIPLGIDAMMSWQAGRCEVAPGATLLLYTDGVTEAHNERYELFGEERLLVAVAAAHEQAPEQLLTTIVEVVDRFAANVPQFDDITLLVLARDQN